MVDHMKNQKAKGKNQKAKLTGLLHSHFSLLIFAFCLLPFSSALSGETLRDPTRPPAALYAPEGGAEIETGPVLQSVRISQGRYTAVISGETVRVGSKYGEAKVVSIKETEVVLKTGNSLQTLKLFPDVEKRPAVKKKRDQR
jgi:MSHA biogenesis protein MshK